MSNFSFIEYSFDPLQLDPEVIYSSLNRLGFVQRNLHESKQSSMWTQNQCIMLLRETEHSDTPHVSGFGLVLDDDQVDFPQDYFDEECGMYVTHDPNGLRILSMPEKNLSKMISHGYQVIDKRVYDTPGLEYFSGAVYNTHSNDILNFYRRIGFKCSKSSEKYDTLMSKNNRFTLLLSKYDSSSAVDVVYSDTSDVFRTTCCYTVAGFNFKDYTVEQSKLNFGSSLNYKITGYNCAAFGNQNSYTIENSVKEPVPNLDLIFRSRKQHLHINEDIVEYHYATA